jgi:hypothetical protein
VTIDVAAAAELFIYGYPLVYCTDEIVKLAGPASTVMPGGVPFNSFGMARRLLGPEAKFVSPNNDTLYVMAPLDLSDGPLLLHTPDTGSRYYVLQFVDAWSNNVAYVGRRASGTAAADWLIAPSEFNGEVPLGATVVEVPSDVAVIVGRVQVDGEADLPAVHALQDQFTLSPLPGSTAVAGVPAVDSQVPDDLMFWERFRVYVRRFPPPAADREFVDMAAAAGLLDDTSPFVDADPAVAAVLVEGAAKGTALIESIAAGHGVEPGTWTSALHMFDYNLDRCGVGTIDTPDWKIPDRKKAYVTRAVAARAGLWGNHGYEADYEIIHQDEHGATLNGAHHYEVTFDPPPPADAFWSLTMYDTPDYYLVDNPIDRYSIGDRTPGLRYEPNGAVTITMQTDTPDDTSNWLPTPPSDFRPILRMYEPGAAILDGTYPFPKIKRLD